MSREDGKDDQVFLLVGVVIVIFMVIPAIYVMYAGNVNGFLLEVAKRELSPFSFLFTEPQIAIAKLSELDPASLDWPMMEKILSYAGTWLRWPLIVILALLAIVSLQLGKVEHLTRKFSMESLLEHNSDNFPCLKPIVGKGKYLLNPESYDKGNWKIARTPIQFAVSKGLLLGPNGVPCEIGDVFEKGFPSRDKQAFGECSYDEANAVTIFKKQLGRQFNGINDLSLSRKAIAAAFVLYANGNKLECMDILDSVSMSYVEKDDTPQCPVLEDGSFNKKISTALANWDEFAKRKNIARHLAYELPLFMALLNEARKKGVLASSQFIWLRPMDRSLWYALNQCGGRVAWVESLAAWSHFQAENHSGRTMHEPQITDAVASLKRSLGHQGWFKDYCDPMGQQINLSNIQNNSQQIVTAPAEEDGEI